MPKSVADIVRNDVAKFAQRTSVKDDQPLGSGRNGLNISHQGFVFLAQTLRAFMKHEKPSTKGIGTADLEKDGLTVGDTIDLVKAGIA
jgi:hypothetical protein